MVCRFESVEMGIDSVFTLPDAPYAPIHSIMVRQDKPDVSGG